MVEQALVNPSPSGGSNPTPSLHFVELPEHTATRLIIEHHYLHRRCPITRAWGIESSGEILGVLTIGVPITFSARCDVVGETKLQKLLRTSRQHDVYELNRLWVSDALPKNTESRFIGWCLKQIRKLHPHMILISYADSTQGHVGYVYQATNWLYIGQSSKFEDIAVTGGGDYRSVPEEIRGGVVFHCDKHENGFFEGPLPPKSKSSSKNLPSVPTSIPCPQCGADASRTRGRAWAYIRDSDGILKLRGKVAAWIHFTQKRIPHSLELRSRPLKHRYVWFADSDDKKILAKPVFPYPKKAA